MERVQSVRAEIVRTAEQQAWDWASVERGAKAAHAHLKDGRLPEEGDEIQTYLSNVCDRYHSRGYPLEDLRDAIDGVQAKPSAQQSL